MYVNYVPKMLWSNGQDEKTTNAKNGKDNMLARLLY